MALIWSLFTVLNWEMIVYLKLVFFQWSLSRGWTIQRSDSDITRAFNEQNLSMKAGKKHFSFYFKILFQFSLQIYHEIIIKVKHDFWCLFLIWSPQVCSLHYVTLTPIKSRRIRKATTCKCYLRSHYYSSQSTVFSQNECSSIPCSSNYPSCS